MKIYKKSRNDRTLKSWKSYARWWIKKWISSKRYEIWWNVNDINLPYKRISIMENHNVK